MNVAIAGVNVDPKQYALTLVQAIVDGGQLRMFARTADEMSLLAASSIKTLYSPFFAADDAGYNSGNLLIGLLSVWLCPFFALVASVSLRFAFLQLRRLDWMASCCNGAGCLILMC